MVSAMQTPETNDSRVRQLLEERSARTEAFRYSTCSDTPSVDSRPFFSPPHTHSETWPYNSPTSHLSSRRLLDDPSSSVLDFDEDIRSSMAFGEVYENDSPSHDREDNDSDGDSLPRMSYLGPKMRFHSRPPWELEEDTLEEVDENESNGHVGFMGILRGKTHKPDLSSSPRPSTATGRPSVESSRSFLNSKRSFDTSTSSVTHPRGALYALAQESLSTSSLGRPHPPARQEGFRGKISMGRLRSHSSTVVDIPSPPNGSATRLPQNSNPTIPPPSPRASCDTTSSTLDVQTGLTALFVDRRIDKGFHPYASPDLVSYSTEPPPPPRSPIRSNIQYPEAPRKDSNTTVVEISAFSAPVKPLTKSAPASEMLKRRISHVQGKEISGPVSILSPDSPIRQQFDEPPSLPHAIPGWTEPNINPGFSLISLEEARAQRRGATLPPLVVQTHESSSSGGSSATTAIETSTTDARHSDFAAARARARSISAGAKAKNALSSIVRQPERRGSENGLATGGQVSNAKDVNTTAGAGKSIKHKKSGFMRLFSNGKVSEREPPPVPQPPSVPSLPQSDPPAFIPRHNHKLSSHRIPVPSLSPSLLEAAAQHDQHLGDFDVIDVSRATISPRRSPPHALSISTGSSPLSTFPRGPFAGGLKEDAVPSSAPPNIGDFPTLKLRPVSTLFSSEFGDHLDVTKLNFDDPESIGPKEIKEDILARRRENERQRQDSLASGSVSSGPSSASAISFMDSQYNLSPIAPSYTGTALTTPTTGGLVSPTSNSTTGPWIRDRDRDYSGLGGGNGRFSVDQQSAPPALPTTNANLSGSSASQHVVQVRERGDAEAATAIRVLQEHLDNMNKMWQKKYGDLESEKRALESENGTLKNENVSLKNENGTLKNEVAELKLQLSDGCEKRGGGGTGIPPVPPLPPMSQQQQMLKPEGTGVMNRPRAKTGNSTRFVNGQL